MLCEIVVLASLLAGELDQAHARLREGRAPEALRELEQALRERPGDPEIQYQIGELLRGLAAERAARLEDLAPDSAEAHQLAGRTLEARGNLEEALARYRAALARNPRLPGLHFLIGNIQWKQRDFEAAQAEMEAELRLNANHALAHLRLGQILLARDQPQAAADHLRFAAGAEDAPLEAHQALGKAYRALRSYPQALHEFQIVAARRPRDESVHAQLAGVYRALGQMERAKAEAETHRRLLEAKADAARKLSPAGAR